VRYASAFDDTEDPSSDTEPAVDMSADSDVDSGMIEVASAPSLLMLSASDDLSLTKTLSDISLTDTAVDDSSPLPYTDYKQQLPGTHTAVDDSRALSGSDHKPRLDNDFYFYQGQFTSVDALLQPRARLGAVECSSPFHNFILDGIKGH